eukprot:SAG11_NODE_5406_length_1570_cov_2.569680_1_plen_54_part_00
MYLVYMLYLSPVPSFYLIFTRGTYLDSFCWGYIPVFALITPSGSSLLAILPVA